MEPLYFVVEPRHGGECAALYHERLPPDVSKRMIYGLRLDLLPNADQFAGASIAQLYAVFCRLRTAGKLPTPNIVPPTIPGAGGSRRKLGEWWKPPVVPWDQTAPAAHIAEWERQIAEFRANRGLPSP